MFVACIRCNIPMDIERSTIDQDYHIHIDYRCQGCGCKISVNLETVTEKIINEGIKRL